MTKTITLIDPMKAKRNSMNAGLVTLWLAKRFGDPVSVLSYGCRVTHMRRWRGKHYFICEEIVAE